MATSDLPPGVTLHRIEDRSGLPQYEVLSDGERIGRVYRCTITVERRYGNQRWVHSRRESKPNYWKFDAVNPRIRSYGIDYDTRKRAVEELVWDVARQAEADAEEAHDG